MIKPPPTTSMAVPTKYLILKSSKVIDMQKNQLGCFHVTIDCLTWIPSAPSNVGSVSALSDMCIYSVCVFSYCCGKQVVFFSHSRRLLKQRAFSVNLSISAVTQLTAGWRAGSDVGKVQINTHAYAHNASVARGAQWEVTHVPVYVNEFSIRRYRWKERRSSSVGRETLMRWKEGGAEVGWRFHSVEEDSASVYASDTRVGFAAQLMPNILINTENWPQTTVSRELFLNSAES